MKPLVLTGYPISNFNEENLGDLPVNFFFRFVWGAVAVSRRTCSLSWPSDGRSWPRPRSTLVGLCKSLGAEQKQKSSGSQPVRILPAIRDRRTLVRHPSERSIAIDLAARLLPFLPRDRGQVEIASATSGYGRDCSGGFAKWRPPLVDVTEQELATASAAWQAYGATTPQACFDLLGKDLSALPLLRPVLLDLLAELPSASTGLGATEMRMLELIGRGYSLTNALFHLWDLRQTRVFGEWENGYLLDGLALGPTPAVNGLDNALCTISRENLRDRQTAYHRSELTLCTLLSV